MSYSQAYKRYVTFLLLAIYIFNQADRGVFGFVMEHIKREFQLSDTELGFLGGPALMLCYALLGIPVARWADRSHRVNIMSIAIFLWSSIVLLTAVAGKFWHFALARIGVGVGEAGFSAVAQSVIADYHTPAERTRALSIFMLALPLGGAMSSLIGGWVNEVWGWRAVFLVAGIPGLVLAVLLKLTVREPPRGLTSPGAAAQDVPPSLRSVLAVVWRRRALRHLAIGMTLSTFLTGGVFGWLVPFFIRIHGVSTGELGTWAAIVTVGGGAGTWLGGHLGRWFKMEDERQQTRVLAVASASAWPVIMALVLWPTVIGALLLWFVAGFLLHIFLAPSFSLVQGLCAARMRATVLSVIILSQALFASVIGVQTTGILSDALTAPFGGEALRWAMLIATPAALWAAAHFWLAGRSIRQDLMDAR